MKWAEVAKSDVRLVAAVPARTGPAGHVAQGVDVCPRMHRADEQLTYYRGLDIVVLVHPGDISLISGASRRPVGHNLEWRMLAPLPAFRSSASSRDRKPAPF